MKRKLSDIREELDIYNNLIAKEELAYSRTLLEQRPMTHVDSAEWHRWRYKLEFHEKTVKQYTTDRDAALQEFQDRRRVQLDTLALWTAGGVIATLVYLVVLTIFVVGSY